MAGGSVKVKAEILQKAKGGKGGQMNKNRDIFGTYNPYVILFFYILVIVSTIILSHPAITVGSFLSAIVYTFYLRGRKAIKLLAFVLPMMLLGAILNPLFNHRGATIITYFRQNPITAEAVAFGIASAFMIGGIIFWFATFNDIMSSEKIMYMGGKVAPSITLVFSMVLRFVPHFRQQMQKVSDGQKAIGRDVASGNLRERAGHGMRIMSIMTTWSLENSVDMADSMKARGFGAGRRSHFAIYKITARDRVMFIVMLIAFVIMLSAGYGYLGMQGMMDFYPRLHIEKPTIFGTGVNMLIILFFLLPVIINVYEDIKWKHLISKI